MADAEKVLIEILDVGDGGPMSRSSHVAYMMIPKEHIIPPRRRWERMSLTPEGLLLACARIRGIPCGYVDYKYVDDKVRSTQVKKFREQIGLLQKDLYELEQA